MSKPGRNDPCLCGSGKKYKQCCLPREEAQAVNIPAQNFSLSQALRVGLEHHQSGRFAQAEVLYKKILQAEPNHPDALHLLGLLARQAGRNDIAAELIGRAVRANPANAKYHNSMGNALLACGKPEAAFACYRHALSLRPDYAEAHYNLGNALKDQGKLDAAIECYRRTLALKPDFSDALSNLGNILKEQGKLGGAVECFLKVLELKPGQAEAHSNLGAALHAAGDSDAAISHFHQALALKPNSAQVHVNLGNALKDQGQPDARIESYRRALALDPAHTQAHIGLGNALNDLGQLDAAIASYQRALELDPDSAPAHGNLGTTLKDQGQLDAAIASYRKALTLKPDLVDAHIHLSAALLLRGEFREGWREYEWRLIHPAGNSYLPDPRDASRSLPLPSTQIPLELAGKRILFVADQGIGDELFFLRFARIAQQRGAWTAYQPSAKIATLVQRAAGLDQVVSDADYPADLEHIFPVGDLPLILGMVKPEDIPPAVPLTVLSGSKATIKKRLAPLGKAPLLGVTWRAGTERKAGARSTLFKETDIQLLGRALVAWPGEVLILQRNPRPDEIEEFERALGRPAHDFSDLNENLEDMLALLSRLDEYVGVSNTNMHLLASLGKTARVLVPHLRDWRWMAEGDESPWFPGFQLYRKQTAGDWGAVLDRLTEDLRHENKRA